MLRKVQNFRPNQEKKPTATIVKVTTHTPNTQKHTKQEKKKMSIETGKRLKKEKKRKSRSTIM